MHPHRIGWRAAWARRRRALAIVTALLWVLGYEVGPSLHLGAHDAAHDHVGGATVAVGPVVRVLRAGEHSHAGVIHRHADASDVRGPDSDPAVGGGPSTPHGEHSAAHRDLGFGAPLPALVAPLPVAPPAIAVVHHARDAVADAVAPPAAARGPPPSSPTA